MKPKPKHIHIISDVFMIPADVRAILYTIAHHRTQLYWDACRLCNVCIRLSRLHHSLSVCGNVSFVAKLRWEPISTRHDVDDWLHRNASNGLHVHYTHIFHLEYCCDGVLLIVEIDGTHKDRCIGLLNGVCSFTHYIFEMNKYQDFTINYGNAFHCTI